MNIFNTPSDFLDFSVNNYPSRNIKKILRHIFIIISQITILIANIFIGSIQWTNHFVKNGYGKNIDELKLFLNNNLKPTKNISLLFNMLVAHLFNLKIL